MIQDGYARYYPNYKSIYMDQFRQAENEAKLNNMGLWQYKDFREMEHESQLFPRFSNPFFKKPYKAKIFTI